MPTAFWRALRSGAFKVRLIAANSRSATAAGVFAGTKAPF